MNQRNTNGFVPRASLVVCAGCLAGMLLGGCDIPQRPVLDPADARRPAVADSNELADSSPEVLEGPAGKFDERWETWDAYFIRNRHVGYAHVVADSDPDSMAGDVRYTLESRLVIQQGRARLLQRLMQTSTETSDGKLVGFQSVLHVGPTVTRFDGLLGNENLEIDVLRGSSTTTRRVPWQSTYRGLAALEQSLRQRPMMEKGQQRTLMMLLPGQYQLASVRLRCAGKALVPLIDGTPGELIETNCEIRIGDQQTYSTIWTDDSGAIVRTFSPDLNLVAYRTDEATATNLGGMDSAVASIAVGGRSITQPDSARRVALRISPNAAARQSQTPVKIDPAPGQYVRAMPGGTFQVLVSRRAEEVAKGFVAADLEAVEEDLRPNHFIDSGATLVRRFAEAAVGARDVTQREVAIELTRTVHQLVDAKPESSGFTKASGVVRDGVGDATERAILLAALLRARKIPARLAIGLQYSPATSGRDAGEADRMRYHVWTLAYADGQWIHLDASQGRPAAADRLTITTTNLSGGNEYDALLPLLETIGDIEIEIVGQS